jgi:hypothetical protein
MVYICSHGRCSPAEVVMKLLWTEVSHEPG